MDCDKFDLYLIVNITNAEALLSYMRRHVSVLTSFSHSEPGSGCCAQGMSLLIVGLREVRQIRFT